MVAKEGGREGWVSGGWCEGVWVCVVTLPRSLRGSTTAPPSIPLCKFLFIH